MRRRTALLAGAGLLCAAGRAAAQPAGPRVAERDHLLVLRQAESVAQRADPPDYYSKVLHPKAGPYDFNLAPIVRQR